MRIVYGLEVHKDSVFVCILSEKGDKFEAKYGVLTPEMEENSPISCSVVSFQ